jgi:hypothetical protein
MRFSPVLDARERADLHQALAGAQSARLSRERLRAGRETEELERLALALAEMVKEDAAEPFEAEAVELAGWLRKEAREFERATGRWA